MHPLRRSSTPTTATASAVSALTALAWVLICAWVPGHAAHAAASWQHPPAEVLEVLNAPELPQARLSPTGEMLGLLTLERYPDIALRARPMLRLGGTRIDPPSNARHGESFYVALSLQPVAGGSPRTVTLPPEPRVTQFSWSADGRRFALLNWTNVAVELWVGETATATIRRIDGLRINPMLYSELQWMPDQKRLLVKRVPEDRGTPPAPPETPAGPKVDECSGQTPSSTYEARDLLTSPLDEELFDYYAQSQLAIVDVQTGQVEGVGAAGILGSIDISTDGRWILVERLHRPWSYTHAWNRFPKDVEIWDAQGNTAHVLAQMPLEDHVPIQGVEEGPREYGWRATEPATLVWLEALDGGDPGRKVPQRDRILVQRAPFTETPREVYRAPHRVEGIWWGTQRGLTLVAEYERERRWRYVRALNLDAKAPKADTIIDISANELYKDPGQPVSLRRPDGSVVLAQEGDAIFLTGSGATPQGQRPFLDRFSLGKHTSERLFRSDATRYEWFVAPINLRSKSFLTRAESPTEVPNYVARTLSRRVSKPVPGEARWESASRNVTNFTDPTPQLRQIRSQIVTYQRADGTPLSFTLYLPPGYKEGTRLPTVLEAYPLEYSDPGTAGQVSGTDRNFTRFLGPTPLFFLLEGYAVLLNTSMPVIGDPDTAYDSFIEQLTADAQAAIDKATQLGVTDPDRVGIIGHSHGALMVATLLAHTDLFRAGIARSGAYNHTLRPFGFQSERRTLYQARDNYIKLSPVMWADRINEPILLIHGDADQNPGTVPLQSQKLYEAIRGTGGTARLVMLPFESHGYQSREAVEEVLADQLEWFDRYVKSAGPRKRV